LVTNHSYLFAFLPAVLTAPPFLLVAVTYRASSDFSGVLILCHVYNASAACQASPPSANDEGTAQEIKCFPYSENVFTTLSHRTQTTTIIRQ
jgi:hypothetical protein